jgi:endonuclease YncB( thermonuclease family)
MSRWLLILLAFALGRHPAAAGPLDAFVARGELIAGGEVEVAAALDGDTLRLSDGRELRLAGVEAPQPDLPRPGSTGGTHDAAAIAAAADAARQALAELAAGRSVTLYYDQRRNDRYGRVVAQVVAPADVWVEAALLRRGLVRVHTARDVAAGAADLLQTEAEARSARRGLWALAAYQVRTPQDLSRWLDSFQIVAGRIAGSHRSPGRLWLEFAGGRGGPALEIAIPSAANRLFRAAKLNPTTALVGADVRVRGWLRWQNGPIIDVDHPAQIEILRQPAAEDSEKRSGR